MAVPKRRTSTTRKAKRRTNWKLNKPTVNICPSCGEPRLPHRACTSCGTYKKPATTAK
ncbi:MAG: 50S ribosomal protein L32 [Firmicutes bacterium]|nr:50S ribosomal protein L32 [Bacillota bacterium]MDD4263477.1 50S ribosomal protein L32 [Bacillota bacterium]MDD4693522.1 50S ribosomal protein L32 [Bacillota bacterium]